MQEIAEAGPQFFWEQCPRDEPKLIDHPVRSVPDYKDRACPLVLHGDGAQYTTHHDSIKSLQWSFLGSDGVGTRTWDHIFSSQFWFLAFAAKKMSMESTLGMWSSAWW